jgi:hypothetical protein
MDDVVYYAIKTSMGFGGDCLNISIRVRGDPSPMRQLGGFFIPAQPPS